MHAVSGAHIHVYAHVCAIYIPVGIDEIDCNLSDLTKLLMECGERDI